MQYLNDNGRAAKVQGKPVGTREKNNQRLPECSGGSLWQEIIKKPVHQIGTGHDAGDLTFLVYHHAFDLMFFIRSSTVCTADRRRWR
ncbi:MAG: hypothetical protein R3E89_10680 [Thiolinea sp.]